MSIGLSFDLFSLELPTNLDPTSNVPSASESEDLDSPSHHTSKPSSIKDHGEDLLTDEVEAPVPKGSSSKIGSGSVAVSQSRVKQSSAITQKSPTTPSPTTNSRAAKAAAPNGSNIEPKSTENLSESNSNSTEPEPDPDPVDEPEPSNTNSNASNSPGVQEIHESCPARIDTSKVKSKSKAPWESKAEDHKNPAVAKVYGRIRNKSNLKGAKGMTSPRAIPGESSLDG